MTGLFINRGVHTAVLLLFLAVALFIRMQDHNWAKSLRFLAFDSYNNLYPRPATDQVVVVDIDEESMAREDLGQWPWSRLALARMVKNLHDMGARVVAFDMVFAEADRTSPQAMLDRMPDGESHPELGDLIKGLPDNDSVLAETIRDAGNAVTAFIWTSKAESTRRTPVLTKPILLSKQAQRIVETVPVMNGVVTSIPQLAEAAAGNGSFGVSPEIDGIIRTVPLLFSFHDAAANADILYPSLALEALRVAQNPKLVTKIRALKPEEAGPFDPPLVMSVGKFEIPLDWNGRFFGYFSKARPRDYIPAWKVIEGTIDPAAVSGKIVFVGTSAEGLKDIRSTPVDLYIPGVEVHVNVAEQILTGSFLLRPKLMEGVEILAIGVVGIFIIVLAPFINAVFMALFTIFLTGGIAWASLYGFREYGLLIDPVYPGLCIGMLFVMSSLLAYIRTEAERRRVRQAFGLYISPDFMAELTKDPDKLRLGGETRELTVMFTDIRSFTTISESMSPEALIQLMNDFLTPMSDLVMANRGTIDKYMGDAMMAFWNAPLDDPDHTVHACRAALKMNEALAPINERLRREAEAVRRTPIVLNAGIGINTGPASIGNMGSRQRFAYSAMGDTVNLASRLEGQTKNYGVKILIGPETQRRIPGFAALELDKLRVKGRTEPVRVYALLGDEEMGAASSFRVWKQEHDAMLESFRLRDFAVSERLIEECRRLSGGQMAGYYDLYLKRIAGLKESRPGESWDGVYEAVGK